MSPLEEADYQALLLRLESEAPLTSGKGLDFTKIRGSFKGRTAKAVVLHLSTVGWSVAELAEALECTPMTVGRYLAAALAESSPIEDLEILRQHELRKLDAMEGAVWKQFERSCEDEEGVREVLDKEGDVRELKSSKGQSGNPAYMRILADIQKRRAAILGLDKPVKKEVQTTNRSLQIKVVEVASRDEVKQLEQAE